MAVMEVAGVVMEVGVEPGIRATITGVDLDPITGDEVPGPTTTHRTIPTLAPILTIMAMATFTPMAFQRQSSRHLWPRRMAPVTVQPMV